MFLKSALLAVSVLGTASLLASPAQADTLRRETSASSAAGMPTRGLSMAQVERRYGAPLEKLPTAGGDKPRHPPINRWRYQGYTVYFERNRVIHSVRDSVVATTAPKS